MLKPLQRLLRSLPVFRGKLRLAKLLLGDLRGPARVTDRFGFSYDIPDLREPLGFHLLINGCYEPRAQDLVMTTLRPDSVFIDVGANVGVFTIPAAARLAPTGRVVAIEASPDMFAVLKNNVALNGISNVHLVCAAAGANETETEFYPAPLDHFGMGSKAPQFDVSPIKVPSTKLDSIAEKFGFKSVSVIKIDVEGFELEVLKGSIELLRVENPPLIVFEFCDWAEARMPGETVGATQQFLMDLGFEIWRASQYGRGDPIRHPVTTGADMFVARK